MDFCFAIASEEILKSIEEGKDKNIVISPASMTLVLNLIASGSTGGTLNQLLAHLKSNDVSAITKNSSLIMKLFLPPPPPSSSTSSQESSSNITQQSQSLDPVNPSNGGFNQLTSRNHNRNYVSGDGDFYPLPQLPPSENWKRNHFDGNQFSGGFDQFPLDFNGGVPRPRTTSYQSSAEFLGDGSKGKGPELCCFNGMYVDEEVHLRSTYKGLAEGVYNAVVKSVNFACKADQIRDEVNTCVENTTKGLLKNAVLLADLKNAVVLIINALYFKGIWERVFKKNKTRIEMFHLLRGETVQVPFMTSNGEKYNYHSFQDFELLKLPYLSGENDKKFSMYFFLPHDTNGLKDLTVKLNSNPIAFSRYFDYPVPLELEKIWIPKLKFSHKFEPKGVMQKLGLTWPFISLEEFTEMADSPNGLYVSKIVHKSIIEVDENGTEAAAYTYAMQVGCALSKPRPRPSFVADHPFMFMIREDISGVLLFIGAVLNPLVHGDDD